MTEEPAPEPPTDLPETLARQYEVAKRRNATLPDDMSLAPRGGAARAVAGGEPPSPWWDKTHGDESLPADAEASGGRAAPTQPTEPENLNADPTGIAVYGSTAEAMTATYNHGYVQGFKKGHPAGAARVVEAVEAAVIAGEDDPYCPGWRILTDRVLRAARGATQP